MSKRVVAWDPTVVTVQDGTDERSTSSIAVTGVVPPDALQEEAFQAMVPELLSDFHTDTNVLFFAFGQTGSGKTHTMLGDVDSLASKQPVPGWGVSPRVVYATLQSMRDWRATGVHSVLLASAVEFYCGAAFDLGDSGWPRAEVTIDPEANVFGVKSTELTSTRSTCSFLLRVIMVIY